MRASLDVPDHPQCFELWCLQSLSRKESQPAWKPLPQTSHATMSALCRTRAWMDLVREALLITRIP